MLLGGPFRDASIYEASLGVLLVIGIGLTFLAPGSARIAGLSTQALTLAGASIGLHLALRGVAPNTPLDIVYHLALMGLLAGGLALAWRIGERNHR